MWQKRVTWASGVQNRRHGCVDSVAAEAIYHVNCYYDFCLMKGTLHQQQGFWVGRPQDKGMLYWFQTLCQWLDSKADAELYALTELHAVMVEYPGRSDLYTLKRLKQKLYDDFIFFAEVEGAWY